MDDEAIAEWIELGLRLRAASPEKHAQVAAKLRDVVEAQEVIASFDWQLALRARRPTKRYIA